MSTLRGVEQGVCSGYLLVGVVLDVLDGSALRGDLREQVGEGAFGRVVRGVVAVVRGVAALAKPLHYAEGYAIEPRKTLDFRTPADTLQANIAITD